MKKISALCLAAIAVFCLASCGSNNNGQDAVATVNGETVTQAELSYFEGRLRADVYAENTSDNSNSSALALKLQKRAMKECVRAKIILIQCRKNGIYTNISYEGLRALAVSYNNAHSNDSGAVGLNTIQLSQFYTYYIDNGKLELQNLLADTVLSPTQDELSAAEDELSGSLSGDELTAAAKKRAISDNFNKYISSLVNDAKIKTDGGFTE